ncbi:MAG: 16S rRNA (uracil(1498)-N(3))-methyltransferase, partial [Myxococcales bacterium]|nr:16S rRNA (uracil(1498)-N(3))-methyltransferase [Myxococcales bacterium]
MARTLRVFVCPLAAGEQLLDPDAAHYVARVHRLAAGEELVLFDPSAGTEAVATLLEVGKKRVRVRAEEPHEVPDIGCLPVRLVQAMGKGDKPERVVKEATALGVSQVVLLESERGTPRVAHTDGRATQRRRRLEASAIDAARQSGRPRIPQVIGPLALEDYLGEVTERCLVLDPRGNVGLLDVLDELSPDADAAVEIWIGPEGGFAPAELELLEARGARRVRFGPLVLR